MSFPPFLDGRCIDPDGGHPSHQGAYGSLLLLYVHSHSSTANWTSKGRKANPLLIHAGTQPKPNPKVPP